LPVLSALARSYAVSDAWFASVPSQTWPNRAFAHAGTSNGNVNNGGAIPDPFDWNVPTIFNVLESRGESWSVYTDTTLVPSLTRSMFPKLWDPWLDAHFEGFSGFVDACEKDRLPSYSFIEPSFLTEPNDMHPPHDTRAADAFLYAIWQAVSTSPGWAKTLLVITFDEHGGCFDHVLPPFNAATPDQASAPGQEGFRFDRFGVRVPTVLVSPYIAAGTVFRSPTATPYDHTSILATLRDWFGIPAATMLPSARIASAPTLDGVLTLSQARTDLPHISTPLSNFIQPALATPPNDLQKSLVAASARRFGLDPTAAVASIATRQHAVDFFKRRLSHAAA
jgi:phospholipase C